MKIAYLNACGNGSTGHIVDKLKEICENNGISVISIYARESCVRQDKTTVRCFNKFDFYIDGILTRLLDNHGLNSKVNTRRILKVLRDFKPDIIHIHNLHGYWINYPMLFNYIKENNIKVVWTFHDCWHITGHCTHFDYVQCDKWKIGCHNCEQLKEYPASSFYDGSKRNYNFKKKYFTSIDDMVIVTPSQWLQSKVKESFLNKYNVRVINNGVDISVFKPSVDIEKKKSILSQGFKHIILGVAATWNERKGLKYILKIADKEPEWYFVIIGSISQKSIIKADYKNVFFINRTENVQILCDWYSIADVFVNPTLEDTYPTTNLESIACGTPVVTYATGGSEEIVRISKFGEVSKERNSKSLHDSVKNVLDNAELVIAADFNLDAQVKYQEYLQLYNQIVDRK